VGTLRLWDPDGWQPVWEVQIEAAGAFPLAFHPRGDRIAVGVEHRVLLLRAEDGALLQELALDPRGIYDLDFSPDGRLLAIASEAEDLHVWKLE
jgi:WD40 repeat protein